MFSNILYLIICLPLLILAYAPGPRYINSRISNIARSTDPSPAALQAATGDTLKRTACYCASPTWNMDQAYGFYFLIDYYNAHVDRHYILEPSCRSQNDLSGNEYDPEKKPILQNHCLSSRLHDPMRYCLGKESDENTFCYTMAGGPDYDTWAFNGQHRTGLPLHPMVQYSPHVVEKLCNESCKKNLSGMQMLRGDALNALKGYYNFTGVSLGSSVVFYPSLDDM